MIKKYVLHLLFLLILFQTPLFAEQRSSGAIDKSYEGLRTISLYLTSPPKNLLGDAKLILVSGYKADGGVTKVEIDQPNSKVSLILTSYDTVRWELTKTQNTNIVGIIVSSQEIPTIIASFDTRAYYVRDLSYATDTENINFERVLSKLNFWFGVEKVDAFRGKYSMPKDQKISGLDTSNFNLTLAGAPAEKPKKDFDFDLIDKKFVPDKWTLVGQKIKSDKVFFGDKAAISESRQEIYIPSLTGVVVYSKNLASRVQFDMPNTFPRISYIPTIAYDSKRKIVTIVNIYSDNFICRFDTVKKEWIDFKPLKDTKLQSLSYDKLSDRYVGWSDRADLVFLSPTGDVLSRQNVRNTLQGLGRLYDERNNPVAPNMTVKPNGNQIALVYLKCESVNRIWSYDLLSHDSVLTYINTMDKNALSPNSCRDLYPS
jgi:hypothetical protein